MMMVTIRISRSIFRHTYIQCQRADIDHRKIITGHGQETFKVGYINLSTTNALFLFVSKILVFHGT